jgi:hypothetical protein
MKSKDDRRIKINTTISEGDKAFLEEKNIPVSLALLWGVQRARATFVLDSERPGDRMTAGNQFRANTISMGQRSGKWNEDQSLESRNDVLIRKEMENRDAETSENIERLGLRTVEDIRNYIEEIRKRNGGKLSGVLEDYDKEADDVP